MIDPELARVERMRLMVTAEVRLSSHAIHDRLDARSLRQARWRSAAQRLVDFLILLAWVGFVIGAAYFIDGLNQ